ncbi:MAG: hypothetical protein P4L84_32780 [Isosphaeraceae bacterium]|nr:hypothetical protein [Isosphaeraceae bacterium]
MPVPPLEIREAAAEAVHRAVCVVTHDDGCGHCDLYTLAGYALLPAITELNYMPQVGNFAALVDPPTGWFQICAEQGGIARGEYHCWLGLPGPDTGRREQGVTLFGVGQLVDFSLRHLRQMVASVPQITRVVHQDENSVALELAPAHDLIRYTRPDDFAPYLWIEGEPPSDVVYTPDLGAMGEFVERNVRRPRLMTELRDRVLTEYARIARERGIPPP